jgi:hypothetical protein
MMCNYLGDEAKQKGNAVPSIEDGVYLDDLADGAELEVETKNHHYKIVKSTRTRAHISGHPIICPEPVAVEIEGSSRGGLVGLKPGFIGRGMHLTFAHPTYHIVTTSRILQIHRIH